MTKYTPREFVKELSGRQGADANTVAVTGMAKPADDDDAIAFSPRAACGRWIRVPLEMLEEVESLGKVSCEDHTHELVTLHFKAQVGTESSVFVQLLQLVLVGDATRESPGFADADELLAAETSGDVLEAWNPFRGGHVGWRPPWTWSRCAKCMLGTRLVLHGAVAAAIAAAGGGTGPSAIAAAKLALEQEFGRAAAELALSQVISGNLEAAARIICKSRGMC
jgi:hypothetical protein